MPRLQLPGYPGEYIDYTLTLPEKGARPEAVVIYVHGFASNQNGEKVLYLKQRFTEHGCAFIAFDHRGHGNSSGTMKELTVSRNLEDLDAITQSPAADFKSRVLIGSSMGGQTAAWYAKRHPDRITANLLIAPGFRFLQNRMRDLGPEGLKTLKDKGEMTIRNEWVEITIGKALMEDGRQYPAEKLIRGYRTPTLILHGTNDNAVPYEDSAAFAGKSKARPLELVLITGGDHRLTDHKEMLFQEMEGFLKRIRLFLP